MTARRRGRDDGPAHGTAARNGRTAGRLSSADGDRRAIHPGYIRDDSRVGSSISARSVTATRSIVADPGLVASHARILDPLAARGIAPEAVTHVFLSHHHPDHTMNAALFPNAEVVDFWARYRDDLWLDHDGDGWTMTDHAQLWLTPGHTEEDASLIVRGRRRASTR